MRGRVDHYKVVSFSAPILRLGEGPFFKTLLLCYILFLLRFVIFCNGHTNRTLNMHDGADPNRCKYSKPITALNLPGLMS